MRISALLSLAVAAACACGPDFAPEAELPASGGKAETGYLSTLAVEYRTTVKGTVQVTAAQRDAFVRTYKTAAAAKQEYVALQVRYAMQQLVGLGLHLNQTGDTITAQETGTDGQGTTTYSYTVSGDGLITHKALKARWGIDRPQDLKQRRLAPTVPLDAFDMMRRFGAACATGFVEQGASLAEYNYFYFYAPQKAGCRVAEATLDVTIENVAAESNPYPEYDRLQGTISAVVFFGDIDHTKHIKRNDTGMLEWREFKQLLVEKLQFKKADGHADDQSRLGTLYRRKTAKLAVELALFSPRELESGGAALFARMVKKSQLVFYLGHSFYGSLAVLQDAATYKTDLYQIFLIGSCWSYEYYTNQILRHKGTANVDVVNDTEMGYARNGADFAWILLDNLITGAEYKGRRPNYPDYSWREIIDRMNRYAAAQNPDDHEIMGVSGVVDNKFTPQLRP